MGKQKILILYLCLQFCLCSTLFFAQFNHIQLQDGLSQSQVFAILQDQNGFVWFGTLDGLNRFDGYQFKVIRTSIYEKDHKHLSDNNITCLEIEDNNTIWIGTEGGGINRLDPATLIIDKFYHQKDDPNSIPSDFIRTIFYDSNKNMWVGTDGKGLGKYLPLQQKFQNFTIPPVNPNQKDQNFIRTIAEDIKRTIWVGTKGGLFKFSTNQFFQVMIDPDRTQRPVNKILIDKRGNIWIGTTEGLYLKKNISPDFQLFSFHILKAEGLDRLPILSIFEDSKGNIWIGTDRQGLFTINQQYQCTHHFQKEFGNPKSIGDNTINSIYEDQSGVLWFGTNRYISKLSSLKLGFKFLIRNPSHSNPLSNNNIWCISEDDQGNYWFGTDQGLNQYSPNTQNYSYYLGQEIVRCTFWNHPHEKWIGTDGNGIFILSTDHRILHHLKSDSKNPLSLSSNKIRVIYQDKHQDIWIGTLDGGLNKVIRKDDKINFKGYKEDIQNPNSIIDNNIYCILEDSFNKLWVGSLGGLSCIDLQTQQIKNYSHDPKDRNSLSNNGVGVIYENTKGDLWIGTDQGLNLFDRRKEIFTHFTKNDGLANDFIYGILEDDQGNLWLSTNQGLSLFNHHHQKINNFNQYDGLLSNEFNAGAFFKDRSGRLFFGGINGISYFFPDQIKINQYSPEILLINFKIQNKTINFNKETFLKKKIFVPYKKNSFTLEFGAMDFNAPQKIHYQWVLEGFDEEWQTNGSSRSSTYTNLEPGTYLFKAKATNSDGIWSNRELNVNIVIPAPFWKKLWFRILLIVFFFSFIYFLYKRKIKDIADRKQELESIISDKTKELRRINIKLEQLAKKDGLTGLANYRSMFTNLKINWKIAQREKKPLAFIMLDVDFFKLYNDSFGHLAGDKCLAKIATILKKSIRRPGDLAARYGGEEFSLILFNTFFKGALHVAKSIQNDIRSLKIVFPQSDISEFITVSMGIGCITPTPEKNISDLVDDADKALYKAKASGRNKIEVYGQVKFQNNPEK